MVVDGPSGLRVRAYRTKGDEAAEDLDMFTALTLGTRRGRVSPPPVYTTSYPAMGPAAEAAGPAAFALVPGYL